MSDRSAGKPAPTSGGALKRVLRACGIMPLYAWLRRDRRSKLRAELDFQKQWASEFREHQDVVLECWRKYRHLDDIIRIAGLTDFSKVLDIGCGVSTVLHFVPGKRFGIDPLAEEYRRIYAYPEEMVIQKSEGEYIPFASHFFDAVFCTNVLDHVSDPEAVLTEVKRVLKPQGRFVLAVEIFPKSVTRTPCHPHSFTLEKVLDLTKRAGFETLFSQTAPWFGLRNYVNGGREPTGEEVILILRMT